eukprot:m.303751 g.303751  ORF g.303751 m.303751 type:complete len:66 (+) comp40840_c0_seq22:3907-4104(+)
MSLKFSFQLEEVSLPRRPMFPCADGILASLPMNWCIRLVQRKLQKKYASGLMNKWKARVTTAVTS